MRHGAGGCSDRFCLCHCWWRCQANGQDSQSWKLPTGEFKWNPFSLLQLATCFNPFTENDKFLHATPKTLADAEAFERFLLGRKAFVSCTETHETFQKTLVCILAVSLVFRRNYLQFERLSSTWLKLRIRQTNIAQADLKLIACFVKLLLSRCSFLNSYFSQFCQFELGKIAQNGFNGLEFELKFLFIA